MADLFEMTAPLMIRHGDGRKQVIAELFAHPEGAVYFETYWHQGQPEDTIHLLRGEVKGEGPWKIDDCVINVLACHGSDAELASHYQHWQTYLHNAADDYPPPPLIAAIARRMGAIPA